MGLGSGLSTVCQVPVRFDALRRTRPLLVATRTNPFPSKVIREIRLLSRWFPTSCQVRPPLPER